MAPACPTSPLEQWRSVRDQFSTVNEVGMPERYGALLAVAPYLVGGCYLEGVAQSGRIVTLKVDTDVDACMQHLIMLWQCMYCLSSLPEGAQF